MCRRELSLAVAVAGAVVGLAAGWGLAAPKVQITQHAPMNVFAEGDAVRFEVTLRDLGGGAGHCEAVVRDYFGAEVWRGAGATAVKGKAAGWAIEIGKLGPGYYELTLEARGDSGEVAAPTTMSFGVVKPVNRTAAEARDGGYRFGLKTWQVGDIWWRRPLEWHVAECADACVMMGLQWTRHQFNQLNKDSAPGMISTEALLKKQMNAVLKIELWPAEFYDTARYGPLAEWEAKANRKGQATRWTVPQKEPYRKWLREQLSKLPADQKVFEIGNEPWGKISPEEWAEYCQLIRGVVKEVRPDAILGSNHGMYSVEWEDRFIKAGGMEGMDMVTIHPYSFTPLPERRTPASIRNYRDYLKDRLGREVDLYVTEYGWSTAPQDRRKQAVSERIQAERTTRQSLMLYAEGMKTLIPHWMADREQDPTEREHFFGFFRISGQPKPVVIAHATCARMIDGSKYVGDLWLGPNIGAMVFQKGGVNTLALWSLDEDAGKGTPVSVEVGSPGVAVVDVIGGERKVNGPTVPLKLTGDVTYVVGVGDAVAQQAAAARELNPERWSLRASSVDVPRVRSGVKVDGNLDEWKGTSPIDLSGHGKARLSWDGQRVYLAAEVLDDKLAPAEEGKPITSGDAVELNLCVRPGRQASLGEFRWFDYTMQFAAPRGSGKPLFALVDRRAGKTVARPAGVECATMRTPTGWTVEASIPISLLKGWNPGEASVNGEGRIAGDVEVTVGDGSGKGAAKAGTHSPLEWPWLVLKVEK